MRLDPNRKVNQLHRQAKYHRGKDLRKTPYRLFRIRVDVHPVLLR